tara:strand:- start:48 stop:212 length:165 start_codon:yes stop_codon:yes gene_type:complete
LALNFDAQVAADLVVNDRQKTRRRGEQKQTYAVISGSVFGGFDGNVTIRSGLTA